jgi:hypothetical protein
LLACIQHFIPVPGGKVQRLGLALGILDGSIENLDVPLDFLDK